MERLLYRYGHAAAFFVALVEAAAAGNYRLERHAAD
jgi:hypothetical protein